MTLILSPAGKAQRALAALPTSKSISNRALAIAALEGGDASHLQNLSNANDTQLFRELISGEREAFDCQDAGTTLRFMVSVLALRNKKAFITGTERMCQRPIGDLVDALNSIGFDISYHGQSGVPPLWVNPINNFSQLKNRVTISAFVSSQFLSSLLMLATKLPRGLTIEIDGAISSRPYIEMTLAVMRQFAVSANWDGNTISILPQSYVLSDFSIEPDWSNASYFYALVALSGGECRLPRLSRASLQGDAAIADIMTHFGVETAADADGIRISRRDVELSEFQYDFTDCPDLAQTVIVLSAALGLKARLSGLASLRVKETDRIAALQNELKKFGKELTEEESGEFTLDNAAPNFPSQLSFATYEDHRMAMALAPLGALTRVEIEHPHVVRKSFPHFWQELAKCGVTIEDKQ